MLVGTYRESLLRIFFKKYFKNVPGLFSKITSKNPIDIAFIDGSAKGQEIYVLYTYSQCSTKRKEKIVAERPG